MSLVGLVRARYEQLASGEMGWGSMVGVSEAGARGADADKWENYWKRASLDALFADFACDDYVAECHRRCGNRGGARIALCDRETLERRCECERPERWHGAP